MVAPINLQIGLLNGEKKYCCATAGRNNTENLPPQGKLKISLLKFLIK